jgi:hypothetical protein
MTASRPPRPRRADESARPRRGLSRAEAGRSVPARAPVPTDRSSHAARSRRPGRPPGGWRRRRRMMAGAQARSQVADRLDTFRKEVEPLG